MSYILQHVNLHANAIPHLRGITPSVKHNLIEVDGEKKIAVFEKEGASGPGKLPGNSAKNYLTHTIHVWNIYPHLP